MQKSKFPASGLLPKNETQAAAFLKEHPEWDGRGTMIAILDTGCDPAAPGMKTTSDGKPKFVDIIDCTGAGDVLLETECEPTNGFIKGLSGKQLKLGKWKNPTNKYKIGIKSAYDLFPAELVKKLKQLNKEKFEIEHHQLVTKLTKEVQNDDLKARLDALNELIKNYEDPGYIFDCVVFHDGTNWKAVLDIDQSGDLSHQMPMANYSQEHVYSSFGEDSMLTYSVNIYDKGRTLSIVTLAGTHGTHVAAITAAHHPEDPILNGLAPGAQLVSLKIGDTRLGSMETGTGLIRAAIEICRLKCDLANMSYGESASLPDVGRFIELLRDEVINNYGCVFVSSAGNSGPALSTLGAPGGTTRGVVGVGAYVHKSMMDAQYALLDQVSDGPYTWSSRGPTVDGSTGISVYAPGAAITSVPTYTIAPTQLMNGTSMSSPNACGCIALLISGLKMQGIAVNPYRVLHAIINSAKNLENTMNVGYLQVQQAWNLLNNIESSRSMDVFYEVEISNHPGARGVYLRELDETSRLREYTAHVQPVFVKNKNPSQNKEKIQLEVQLCLKSNASWVKVPEFLSLNNGGRGFVFQVDPTLLQSGLSTALIYGTDLKNPNAGPVLRIPITVCKPHDVSNQGNYAICSLKFEPGTIQRHFVSVPRGSNFCEMIIKCKQRDTGARIYTHLLQLRDQTRFEKFEQKYSFVFSSQEGSDDNERNEVQKTFSVLPGKTMEICLAQFWSSLSSTEFDIEFKFHGLFLNDISGTGIGFNSEHLLVSSGHDGFARFDLTSTMRKEQIDLSVKCTHLRKFLRPTQSTIQSLYSRDVLPNSKQIHELILDYSLDIGSDFSVTPRVPRMNDVLYDSSFDNFELLIFDAYKRMVSFQDVYAKEVKLTQGKYVIKIQVTSAKVDVLEKLKKMVLSVDYALSKSISMNTFSRLDEIVSNESTLTKFTLHRGESRTIWIGDASEIPSEAIFGDLLVGTVSLKRSATDFLILYPIPPEAKKDTQDASNFSLTKNEETKKDEDTKCQEAIQNFEIDYIDKVEGETQTKLFLKLKKQYPKSILLFKKHVEFLLNQWDTARKADQDVKEAGLKLQEASDQLLALVDESNVAQYFGQTHDSTEKEKEVKKEMELQKESITLSHLAKSCVLMGQCNKDYTNFDQEMIKASRFITDPLQNVRYLFLWIWRKRQESLFGIALKELNNFFSNKLSKIKLGKKEEELVEELAVIKLQLFKDLGWSVWEEYERKWRLKKFPQSYSPF